MADDDPTGAGPPGGEVGWPYRPAQPDRDSAATPPWARPAPPTGRTTPPPSPLVQPKGPPTRTPARPGRRRLGVIATAAAVLLVGAVTVAVLITRGGDEAARPESVGGGASSTASRAPAPGASSPAAGRPGSELTLLAGRVVVAARPGWEALESSENNASVRLALKTSTGREVLATLTIVTLSDPSSFDTTLKIDGGTSFEFTGTDGPFRVTVQPGLAGRIAAGAARPTGAFFVNLSIFALDGGALDAPTLRALFTDQVAPALRFP